MRTTIRLQGDQRRSRVQPWRDIEANLDELPLHPVIRRWLQCYLDTTEQEHDRVFAEALTEWNAMLHHAGLAEDIPANSGA